MKRIARICFTSVVSTQQDRMTFETSIRKYGREVSIFGLIISEMLLCKVSLSFYFDKVISGK